MILLAWPKGEPTRYGTAGRRESRLSFLGPFEICVRTLVPKTMKGMVFGTRDLKY